MNRTVLAFAAVVLVLVAGITVAVYDDDDDPYSAVIIADGTVERTYGWSYDGITYSLALKMPMSDYYAAAGVDRGTTTLTKYPQYIDADADVVRLLASSLSDTATKCNITDVPAFLLAFVQNIPYKTDYESTGYVEYPKYPIETLVDYNGDCEDVVGLYVSLLRALDYRAVMIFIPTGSNSGHMAAGVAGNYVGGEITDKDSTVYHYAECTNPGWVIGELPNANDVPFGASGTQILGGAA